jgi:prepilin-type N-terminal cleavage/methylation domain-containing protein
MQQKRSGAFTLIELLVVIAIIAILAAILFPVFAQAREKARQITCLSNFKQLGLAMMQYVQDSDELYPGSYYYGQGWAEEIYPYAKSVNVYQCPDDSRTPDSNATSYYPDKLSYVENVHIADYPSTSVELATPANLSQLSSPSTTVLLYEGQASYTGYFGPGASSNNAAYPTNWTRLFPRSCCGTAMDNQSMVGEGSGDWYTVPVEVDRHSVDHAGSNGLVNSGHANFLAADGHAKYLGASWDDMGGSVSVGDMPSVHNAFTAVPQGSLSQSQNGLANYTMSFNPSQT